MNLQIGAYIIGLMLEALVVDAMRRGPYKRYPFVFLYVITDFFTTVLEIEPNLTQYKTGLFADQQRYSRIFWRDEQIIQALLFLLVISLIYRAIAETRQRRTVLLGVIGATVLLAAVSFGVHWGPHVKMGKWMTAWTRDLNFCAVILDLGLWALLIRSGEKDYRLLMLSGALGIQFAASAMSQALRQVSPNLPVMVDATGWMIMVANLARTYIWWQAFRPPKTPKHPKNAYTKNRAA